jgi:hypothetical protein
MSLRQGGVVTNNLKELSGCLCPRRVSYETEIFLTRKENIITFCVTNLQQAAEFICSHLPSVQIAHISLHIIFM